MPHYFACQLMLLMLLRYILFAFRALMLLFSAISHYCHVHRHALLPPADAACQLFVSATLRIAAFAVIFRY